MTTKQLDILSMFASGDSISNPSPEMIQQLRALKNLGFLSDDVLGNWYITDAGLSALFQAQQVSEQAKQQIARQNAQKEETLTNQKRNNRSEWLRFVLGLIIGWLLGAITPFRLWDMLVSLFH